MIPVPVRRILLVGDAFGIPELLNRIPSEEVIGLVAAGTRPQFLPELQDLANKFHLPFIVQPRTDTTEYQTFFAKLEKLEPESLLCCSYSMLIPTDILNLVGGCALNVHMSLLPRNRGPNPIQWAIINGEKTTGVTLHVMDSGIDSGSIVDQESVEISGTDTWKSLLTKVQLAQSKLLDRAIPRLLRGEWKLEQQREEYANRNPRISESSFEIDFSNMTDWQVYNLVRAQVAPLKGAYLKTENGIERFTQPLKLAEIAELRKQRSESR